MLPSNTLSWDPCEVLNINLIETTCRGKTLKGAKCNNPLNKDMRAQVETVIFRLRHIDPCNVQMKHILEVVNLLLCNRYHRGVQDQAKATEYFTDLQYYLDNGVSRHQKAAQHTFNAVKARSDAALQSAAELCSALKETNQRLSNEAARSRALEEKNEKLRIKAKCTTFQNEEHLSRINALEDKAAADHSQIERLKGLLEQRSNELNQLKAAHEGELTKQKQQTRTLGVELDETRGQNSHLQARCDELAQANSDKDSKIESLKNHI